MAKQTQSNRVIREFGLSSLSVDNRVSVYVVTVIIALMGAWAYLTIPKESFPEIVIPTVYVGTPYPGNSPLDIENLITRPIEKEIKGISGIKHIKSNSVPDYSTVVVEFNPEVAINRALRDVKDAVDKAKKDLPSDLDEDPNVFEINFSEFPIMNINLSGDFPMDRLHHYAEYLESAIEKLPEISKVAIKGVPEKEVKVLMDPYQMQAREVTFRDVEDAIRGEHVTMSAGNMRIGHTRRDVRIIGEFEAAEGFGDIIVKDEGQEVVYLRDVATVRFDYQERDSYARNDGYPVVSVDVVKRSGANLLAASDKIDRLIEQARQDYFPPGLNLSITNDQSEMTRMQVNNLENSIVSGVILVILVLLFFLGLRNALFVGIAIPLSMFMSFIVLSLMGVTLNIIVLFSLILALGMLVDNGIVVVENIYRLREEGFDSIRASKEGAGEVAWAIITSTATTLSAFIPLAFWGDIIGEFMKYLPITLIIVLASSLFVGLVINPVLTSKWMIVQKGKQHFRRRIYFYALGWGLLAALTYLGGWPAMGSIFLLSGVFLLLNRWLLSSAARWFQYTLLPRLDNAYEGLIRFALTGRRPYHFFGATCLLLVLSIVLLFFRAPSIDLFPNNEPKYVNVFLELPPGTDIAHTNRKTLEVEAAVNEVLTPDREVVKSVLSQVGKGANDPNAGPEVAASQDDTPNRARIMIDFVEFEYRGGKSTARIMEDIRERLQGTPGIRLTVDKNREGPPVGKPVNIEISGPDYAELIRLSEAIRQHIRNADIPGIEELQSDLETGKPELIVHIDRQKAGRFGVSTGQAAGEIRTALFGKEVSKFKVEEDDYPVMIRLDTAYRHNLEALLNQQITFRDPGTGKIHKVPLSAFAEVQYTSTYGAISRKDLDRVITLSSNVTEGYNANKVVQQIKSQLRDFELPPGYTVRFTGEQEEQAKSQAFLTQALLIALALIYFIIVSQFNSMLKPFIIVATVFFSTTGVLLGLAIFKMPFIIIMTGIGIISLAGVVVNNAIVLLDYTDLVIQRERHRLGMETGKALSFERFTACLVEGGKKRLRPVLLTAITTVLGLLPLATGMNIDYYGLLARLEPNIYFGGDNANFWGPMAWTVIFGLLFATFLTLVILPVMYWLIERLQRAVR